MSFFAVLFALILEQARPLARGNWMHVRLRRWARWSRRSIDAGRAHLGWIAWSVAVIVPSALTLLINLLLWQISSVLAFLWSVAILYATLGFRQFSHHFTTIRDALDDGDEDGARELLANWRQVDSSELPRSEIVRHVIEYSVLAAHRHVFGVLGWFSVFAALGLGPAGAVFYRMAEFVSRYWESQSNRPGEGASAALQRVAARAWSAIDYLPARITALGFAVVGSFEDAIDAWRTYIQQSRLGPPGTAVQHNDGVILAATSGAVNVQLGGLALRPRPSSPASEPRPSAGLDFGGVARELDSSTAALPGRQPEVGHLRSIVGLVWRSVVLWMVLLALLTLARLLG
ncbi:MAG: CobD/CbiB family protein [Polaromonas sp.]|nr:CobD/CbiB family protein [Polaromonas sp.]